MLGGFRASNTGTLRERPIKKLDAVSTVSKKLEKIDLTDGKLHLLSSEEIANFRSIIDNWRSVQDTKTLDVLYALAVKSMIITYHNGSNEEFGTLSGRADLIFQHLKNSLISMVGSKDRAEEICEILGVIEDHMLLAVDYHLKDKDNTILNCATIAGKELSMFLVDGAPSDIEAVTLFCKAFARSANYCAEIMQEYLASVLKVDITKLTQLLGGNVLALDNSDQDDLDDIPVSVDLAGGTNFTNLESAVAL